MKSTMLEQGSICLARGPLLGQLGNSYSCKKFRFITTLRLEVALVMDIVQSTKAARLFIFPGVNEYNRSKILIVRL